MRYEVSMDSVYGSEIFDYDTLREAYQAIARLATKAAELNDGIVRVFAVSEL